MGRPVRLGSWFSSMFSGKKLKGRRSFLLPNHQCNCKSTGWKQKARKVAVVWQLQMKWTDWTGNAVWQPNEWSACTRKPLKQWSVVCFNSWQHISRSPSFFFHMFWEKGFVLAEGPPRYPTKWKWSKVSRPTRNKIGYFGDVHIRANLLARYWKK